jgi:Holliday junction DNA helicase RuvA
VIGSVKGQVVSLRGGTVTVECGGVGFDILATATVLARARLGETTRVLTSLVAKDDGLTLYGFADDAERDTFAAVQTVSGIGPRIALALLAQLSPAELAAAVQAGDTAALTRVPGVGKKVAQRLVLELAGKLVAAPEGAPAGSGAAGEVTAALVGLGWAESDAAAAVTQVSAENPGADVPALLKAALRRLGAAR